MESVEDKLIIAKLMDKIKISKIRNKIVNTEFLTPYQREIIQRELNKNKIKNYLVGMRKRKEKFLFYIQINLTLI